MSRRARRGQRRRLGHKTAQQQAWQAPINRLLKAKQYDEAKQQLQQLLAQYPNNAAMHLQLAHVYYQLEQYPLAIKHYQQAQELGASGRNLYLQLARSHIKQQNYRAALPHTEALLQANDKDVDALILHAGALFPSGEPQAALEHYQRAFQLDPQRPDIYTGIAQIKRFKPDSAVFKLLQTALTKTDDAEIQANYLATLGKAYLDIGDDEQAFAHYQQANELVSSQLITDSQDFRARLHMTRSVFTPALYQGLVTTDHGPTAQSELNLPTSAQGEQPPQIIIAGMSRSGKSLVESLFRGVDNIELAGETQSLSAFTIESLQPFGGNIYNWLKAQNPHSIAEQSAQYLQRLGFDGQHTKVTTMPGDLWYLGVIGLWAPQVPIIFTVRDVLDLGITGYFQQYAAPQAYAYSYDLEHLGRQIAIFEKLMEHWAQVLPNPIYLVDYEALVAEPETVMHNLLGQLGLTRSQDYEQIVAEHAHLVDQLSPIHSADAPMPVTNRFVGIGRRFQNALAPMVKGYEKIVEQFPRMEPPRGLDPLPPADLGAHAPAHEQPSQQSEFSWQLSEPVIALDNGVWPPKELQLLSMLETGGLGIVVFDPSSGHNIHERTRAHEQFQYVPQALLGDGQPTTFYATLDARYSATLPPLSADATQQPDAGQSALAQSLMGAQKNAGIAPTQVLAKLPVDTYRLDAIDGLNHLDWLLLNDRQDALAVLEHGSKRLQNALLIHIDLSFVPRYQRQPSYPELLHWASHNGFQFYGFVDLHYSEADDLPADIVTPPKASRLQDATLLLLPNAKRLSELDDNQRLKLSFILDVYYGIHDFSYELLHAIGPQLGENYLKARGHYDQDSSGPAAQALEQAQIQLQGGYVHRQYPMIANWQKQYPRQPRVNLLFARALLAINRQVGIFAYLDQALKADEYNLTHWLEAGHILLDGRFWWEGLALANSLLERLPDEAAVQQLYARAVAQTPQPDAQALAQALDYTANPPIEIRADQKRHYLHTRAQLLAHQGQTQQAQDLFKQALDLLNKQYPSPQHGGPERANLLLDWANSCALSAPTATELLWQACSTYPYSPTTVLAYQRLRNLLPQSTEATERELAPLHQEIERIWSRYQQDELEVAFGDFGLPYQGFEPLCIPGSRPTMQRLEHYNLKDLLPKDAQALDIGCNNGFLLIGLAPYLQRGVGFDISHSCVQIGQAVAQHLGHEHIHLQQSTFDKFKNQDRFDLIIACAVHHWIGLPIEELADQLQRWCADEGLLLLESQGRRSIYRTEPDFEQKVQAIAAKGFEIVRRGSLCDDGLNYRAFVILRKHPTTEN